MDTPQKKTQAPNATRNAPTTGHSWDGVEEYNNPLPRWWLWTFIVSIIFAVGYCVYYPAWPTWQGTSGWSSQGMLSAQMQNAAAQHAAYEQQMQNLPPEQINKNPELRTYAVAAGKALFAVNCSQCHGAGGAGAPGYPNLLDDEWLHGGSLAAIAQTIAHGVRFNADAESRQPPAMMAYGKDGTLTAAQIEDLVNYLSVIGLAAPANESTARGATLFAENCTSCHGNSGEGNREMGAPPLNNPIWLYGGSHASRLDVITNGRAGVMPAWLGKLTQGQVNQLAVYVHSLGGGEADVAAPVVSDTVPAAAPATPAE